MFSNIIIYVPANFSNEFSVKEGHTKPVSMRQIHGKEAASMCCDRFCAGLFVGMAAGTVVGIRMKANERKLRRTINRTARNVENIFDSMGR